MRDDGSDILIKGWERGRTIYRCKHCGIGFDERTFRLRRRRHAEWHNNAGHEHRAEPVTIESLIKQLHRVA
jgi:hypothetical protein